ncbi:MAG: methyltransferase [Microbacteriaceae bacterium]|nr:MAG: methyltransferase [Microbacteriaceae bacterium]
MTSNNEPVIQPAGTLPDGLRDACLADPPWKGMGGEKHYNTMTQEAIEGMGAAIQAIMKPDSWLFLWTTKSLVNEAKAVMTVWGYDYRDTIYWVKPNHFGFGNQRVGIRRATEMLLVGTRGNVVSNFRSQPDWFPAPVGLHSEKPLEQYAIVGRIAGPNAHAIELFARRRFPDARWGFWGDELDQCDVSLAPWGYPVPADFNDSTAPTATDGGRSDG